jgi:hypothetical protein
MIYELCCLSSFSIFPIFLNSQTHPANDSRGTALPVHIGSHSFREPIGKQGNLPSTRNLSDMGAILKVINYQENKRWQFRFDGGRRGFSPPFQQPYHHTDDGESNTTSTSLFDCIAVAIRAQSRSSGSFGLVVLGARRVIWAQWIRFSITASLLRTMLYKNTWEREWPSLTKERGVMLLVQDKRGHDFRRKWSTIVHTVHTSIQ